MINNGFDYGSWGKLRLDLPEGATLGSLLGKGTRGEVYAATVAGSDAPSGEVAIKVTRDYARRVYSCDERYKRESLLAIARELHLLLRAGDDRSGNLAKLYGSYVSPDQKDLYFVLEKAHGSLRKALQANEKGIGEADAKAIVKQLLTALSFAHESAGYAHLDVCSENVLMTSEDIAKSKAILADFGFCRPLATALPNANVVALGYRAPELLFLGGYGGVSALIANLARVEEGKADPSKQLDLAKVDIFAAGVLLCEMLLGRIPVTAETVTSKVDPTSAPAAVEAGKAARLQFLALFKDLMPSFDHARWEAKQQEYSRDREEYPADAALDDEIPLNGLGFTDDEMTDIKIKPKVLDALLDEALLSPTGIACLKLMLCEDPAKRPTASELLKHEWFASKETFQSPPATAEWLAEAVSLKEKSYEELIAWVEGHCKSKPTQHVMVSKN